MLAEPRVADLVGGVGLGELADADLVIGCVDTRRARVQLLGRCSLAGAALLDGGTSASGAELRLRVSADEPCFGCTLSAHQRSMSDLPWSCAEPLPDELPQASAIATTAVAAGWLIRDGVRPDVRRGAVLAGAVDRRRRRAGGTGSDHA